MPQYEYVPRRYAEDSTEGIIHDNGVYLRSKDSGSSCAFTFEPIRPNLFRTTFSSEEHPLPFHPSVPRPEVDNGSFHCEAQGAEPQKKIQCGDITATVDWAYTPVISLYWTGSDKPLHRDLTYRSYATDSVGIAHYTEYKKGTLHVGLGERAAPMDLSGRHFVLSAMDCFGYDVYRTDPLYKHIPLLINATPDGCVGMFSTAHSRGTWCVGSEIDGLWGRYKVYRQDHGGLEEYLIVGRTIKDVVRTYADLAGYPKLVPRWAFGYIAGGMKYSMLDEPRACEALQELAENLRKHDIPCSAFQMSSGYTVAETEPKTRNVFTWNRHRFPDPQAFTASYHAQGIRLIANVKPYVLANHPEYDNLKKAGALFVDPRTNKTAVTRLWSAGGGESGEGSHIDFTSAAGFKWWYDSAKTLREQGIDVIWNDNNEFTISNDNWICALDEGVMSKTADAAKGYDKVGLLGRYVQTELMGKASHDAVVDSDPEARPFVLTRSATAGTMRYAASSWSGDNVTSWESMKGSVSLSLTAGMCLLQCYGHDIGGFEGPQPSPELLLRWVQLGIYSTRFAVNCFKTSPENNNVGEVIELFMYPEVTPLVRNAIKRRYALIPYTYSLALESHTTASPPLRWVGWGHESDPEVWTPTLARGDSQFWFGDTLMIGCVDGPGVNTMKMYLPKGKEEEKHAGFINLNAPHEYLPAGQWVDISCDWKSSIPVLAKVGGAIPVGKDSPTYAPGGHDYESPQLSKDDYRAIEIFPPQGSSHGECYTSTWYEDDGISANPQISSFTVSYSSTETEVAVTFSRGANNVYKPVWQNIDIILPVEERRSVFLNGKRAHMEMKDAHGRNHFKVLND
ncbi:putative alpha-glucosidase [Lineolata rhizophorae]|uniref:alpha-glucosidase n=1 Tax=Lineolata rhizophorae TaxID=578093 RepID=A0A6A6NU30_9PEZI|nr:putative alpha-glucosidase [Lineolata rhizophorae]